MSTKVYAADWGSGIKNQQNRDIHGQIRRRKSGKKTAGGDAEKSRILLLEYFVLSSDLEKRNIPQGIGLIEMVPGDHIVLQFGLDEAPGMTIPQDQEIRFSAVMAFLTL